MVYVYRLLRPEEKYANGINAKDPKSTTSVFEHVLDGSWGTSSKYISTCGSLQSLTDFASKSKNPGKIIKIKIETLPQNVKMIDLRDKPERMKYIKYTDDTAKIRKFHNFANKFNEVLLAGHIPASCIKRVKEKYYHDYVNH